MTPCVPDKKALGRYTLNGKIAVQKTASCSLSADDSGYRLFAGNFRALPTSLGNMAGKSIQSFTFGRNGWRRATLFLGYWLTVILSVCEPTEGQSQQFILQFPCSEQSGQSLHNVEVNLRQGWVSDTIREVEDLAQEARRKIDQLTVRYGEHGRIRPRDNHTIHNGNVDGLPEVTLNMARLRQEAAENEQILNRMFDVIARATLFLRHVRQEERTRGLHVLQDFHDDLADIESNLSTILCHFQNIMRALQVEEVAVVPPAELSRTLGRRNRRQTYLRDLAIIVRLKRILEYVLVISELTRDDLISGA